MPVGHGARDGMVAAVDGEGGEAGGVVTGPIVGAESSAGAAQAVPTSATIVMIAAIGRRAYTVLLEMAGSGGQPTRADDR